MHLVVVGRERGRAHADRERGHVRLRDLGMDAVHRPRRAALLPHLRRARAGSPTTAPTTTRSTARRRTTTSSRSSRASSTKRSASSRSRRCSRSSTTTRPTSCCSAPTRSRPTTATSSRASRPCPIPAGPVMVANDFLNYMNVEATGGGGVERCEHGRVGRHRSGGRARHHHRPGDDDGPPPQRRPARLTGPGPGYEPSLRRSQDRRVDPHAPRRPRLQLLPVPHREERPRRGALPRQEDPARGEGAPAPPVRARQVEVGPVLAVHAPDVERQPRLVVPDRPAGDRGDRRVSIWPTVWLVGLSTVLSTIIGLLLGIKSAWQRNSWFDRLSTGVSMFTYATPDFFLGILLLAGVRVRAEPAPDRRNRESGRDGRRASTISGTRRSTCSYRALTLTIGYMGEYAIVMRSSLLEVMGEDFLKVARPRPA